MAELLAGDAFLAAAKPRAEVVHGDPCSYAELGERVAAGAASLRAELPPGGLVLLSPAPTSKAIAAYLAVMRAGMVAVPVDPGSGEEKIATILEQAQPAARIGDFGRLTAALAGVPEWQPPRRQEPLAGRPPATPSPDAPALVLYTSGTTAAPKGVVLSHRNLAANTASILAAVPLHRGDVVALVLPLHYSYGLSVLHTTLAAGAQLAPAPDFAIPAECARRLARAGTTVFPGVPFHFNALLDHRTGFDREGMPDLRAAMVAGGAMPTRLVSSFRRRFPDADLHVMYGQTEATARLSSLPPSELTTHPGSIGRGIPGVELTVLRADGTPVAAGEVGEIHARGDNVMRGYLGDAAASAAALGPHGLRTGDLARVDAEGHIYIVGRRSEFAKLRGVRVSLAAVEAALESCSEVAEAVVMAVAGDRGEESLVAEVALDGGAGATDPVHSLQRQLRDLLPSLERPRRIRLVDSIPRTASGKKIRWRN